MSANLIEMAEKYLTPSLLAKLGEASGLSPELAKKAMEAVLPATVASALSTGSTDAGGKRLMDVLDEVGFDGSLLGEVCEKLGPAEFQGVAQASQGVADAVFGGRIDAIGDSLSKVTGIGKSSIMTLLSLAAPMVMSLLGKTRKEQGLAAGGIRDLLMGQKDFLAKLAPSALAGVLGNLSLSSPTMETVKARVVGLAGGADNRAMDAFSTSSRPIAGGGSDATAKWLGGATLCVVVLAAAWWLSSLARQPMAERPAPAAVADRSLRIQGEPVSNAGLTTLPSR